MTGSQKARYGWDHPAPPSWRQFVVWVFVGPLVAAGVLAAFTPLIVVTTPMAAGLVLVVGSRAGMNASAFGALSGLGLGPILVGCLNLDDPSFSPLPWLAIGLVLIGGGIAGYRAVIKVRPSVRARRL